MTKTTYKVGDKVRILDAKKIQFGSSYWNDGDITEVKRVLDDGRPCLARNDMKRFDRGLPLYSRELQYIEKVAEQVAKFKVGNKAIVVSTEGASMVCSSVGTIVEIIGKTGDDRYRVLYTADDGDEGVGGYISGDSIKLISQKPTKNQRITALEQTVADLQAEVEALKAAQKPPITVIADAIQRYKERTPNEQRKAIIDEAKAFVEDVTHLMAQYGHGNKLGKHGRITTDARGWILKVEFIVNAEKRTVVALLRPYYKDEVCAKAIAKCAPDDVFNADIGKAIALGRALGLDVSKFEKAVQPTELVVGHIVTKVTGPCGLGRIGSVEDGKARIEDQFGFWETTLANSSTLLELDDTEAQY